MKVYLDTNILYSYLKRRLENKIVKKEDSNDNLIFPTGIISVTSFFTFGEIIEVLKKEMRINRNVLEEFLKNEIEKLHLEIVKEVSIDKEILEFCFNGLDLKDALHLTIAKQYKLAILTNDLKLLSFSRSIGMKSFNLKEFKNLSFKL
ncbi:MAG: type II toxin-antitoxin system VapC family toxin [Candidatus Aenigmatarchaeota archaeon]